MMIMKIRFLSNNYSTIRISARNKIMLDTKMMMIWMDFKSLAKQRFKMLYNLIVRANQ